jgi:hypothetical protein
MPRRCEDELALEAQFSYEHVLHADRRDQLQRTSWCKSCLIDRSAATSPEHAWNSTPDLGEQQHASGQVEIEARPMNRELALVLVEKHDAKVGTASGRSRNPRSDGGVGLVL